MKFFFCNGEPLEYFYHEYNQTYKKERIIEVPIIMDYYNQFESSKILEVGNVLSNYFNCSHDVIDKYDSSKNVIREDIVEYNPTKRYSLAVSISTIEHIGVEDSPPNPRRVFDAIDNLRRISDLSVITIPMGFNKFLDSYIYNEELSFDEKYGFKRISRERWVQVDWEDITESNYDSPYGNANELFVGVIKNEQS